VTYDLRARPLLVLLFLVVAAAACALFVLQRTRHTSDPGSSSTKTAVAAHGARPKAAAPHHAAAAPHHAAARPKPKPHPKPKPKAPSLSDGLPAPIRRALAADNVVVVALYDPRAKIDGTAMREARAGAEKAGSSFVRVDVRDNAVVNTLNAKYGVLQDPAVLVLQPPGSLVVRIDGFADRETVAQAALNAAS
jgi:hypothetical protein